MNKKFFSALTLVLLLGAGCSDTGAMEQNSDTSMDTVPEMNDAPTENNIAVGEPNPADGSMTDDKDPKAEDADKNVKSFTVSGGNFSFTPSTMTVKKGDTVRITFKNDEGFHDLKIDEFKIATKQIAAGAEETVEFVADKAGSFEYYCSVGKHRQMGMVGTLTVTE